MNFKVGDRVKRIAGEEHIGKVGTVVRVEDFVYIRWDTGGPSFGSYPDRLLLLKFEPREDYEMDA